ncbi:MAG TPA: FxLYD domain-containing protein [Candidatus Nitrosopolaris sp.]|nr:FxLYD domain-containing protein [Candidatus Nitrosopolaris sp.]
MLDKITNMNSIFIIMPMLLVLSLTFAAVTINHVLAIATIGGNSNNMTRYIDPEGRFSIDYPTIWTGVHVTNRFQDMLESDQPPYTALIVDMLSTNISNPAVIANTYKMGFSIPQNVECVKYQVEGQKACSYMIKITKPKGTNLEGEQIFSHVNDKMFMFTMVSEQGDFGCYLPIFQNMLTSFRSPPDTSETPNPTQASQPPPAIRNPQFIPQPPLFPPYQQQQPYSFPPYQQQPANNYLLPRILSQSTYTDSIGAVHIVGEVINQSPVTAKFVQITVTFYNAHNQVIGTDFTYTHPSDLAPGQRAPFELIELSGGIPMNQVRNYALTVDAS